MKQANAPLTPKGRHRLVALVEEEGLTFEASSCPPRKNSSISTPPFKSSRSRASIAPRSLCRIAHAVSWQPIPSWPCSCLVEIPG